MNEAVDAKIVKVVYIESCKECPYRGWSGHILYTEECQVNSESWYCAKRMRDDMLESSDCDISDCVDNETFWSKCPLDQAMCVITEEVQE